MRWFVFAFVLIIFATGHIGQVSSTHSGSYDMDSYTGYPYDYNGDSYTGYSYDYSANSYTGYSYDYSANSYTEYPYDYSGYSYDYTPYTEYPYHTGYSWSSGYTDTIYSTGSYINPGYTDDWSSSYLLARCFKGNLTLSIGGWGDNISDPTSQEYNDLVDDLTSQVQTSTSLFPDYLLYFSVVLIRSGPVAEYEMSVQQFSTIDDLESRIVSMFESIFDVWNATVEENPEDPYCLYEPTFSGTNTDMIYPTGSYIYSGYTDDYSSPYMQELCFRGNLTLSSLNWGVDLDDESTLLFKETEDIITAQVENAANESIYWINYRSFDVLRFYPGKAEFELTVEVEEPIDIEDTKNTSRHIFMSIDGVENATMEYIPCTQDGSSDYTHGISTEMIYPTGSYSYPAYTDDYSSWYTEARCFKGNLTLSIGGWDDDIFDPTSQDYNDLVGVLSTQVQTSTSLYPDYFVYFSVVQIRPGPVAEYGMSVIVQLFSNIDDTESRILSMFESISEVWNATVEENPEDTMCIYDPSFTGTNTDMIYPTESYMYSGYTDDYSSPYMQELCFRGNLTLSSLNWGVDLVDESTLLFRETEDNITSQVENAANESIYWINYRWFDVLLFYPGKAEFELAVEVEEPIDIEDTKNTSRHILMSIDGVENVTMEYTTCTQHGSSDYTHGIPTDMIFPTGSYSYHDYTDDYSSWNTEDMIFPTGSYSDADYTGDYSSWNTEDYINPTGTYFNDYSTAMPFDDYSGSGSGNEYSGDEYSGDIYGSGNGTDSDFINPTGTYFNDYSTAMPFDDYSGSGSGNEYSGDEYSGDIYGSGNGTDYGSGDEYSGDTYGSGNGTDYGSGDDYSGDTYGSGNGTDYGSGDDYSGDTYGSGNGTDYGSGDNYSGDEYGSGNGTDYGSGDDYSGDTYGSGNGTDYGSGDDYSGDEYGSGNGTDYGSGDDYSGDTYGSGNGTDYGSGDDYSGDEYGSGNGTDYGSGDDYSGDTYGSGNGTDYGSGDDYSGDTYSSGNGTDYGSDDVYSGDMYGSGSGDDTSGGNGTEYSGDGTDGSGDGTDGSGDGTDGEQVWSGSLNVTIETPVKVVGGVPKLGLRCNFESQDNFKYTVEWQANNAQIYLSSILTKAQADDLVITNADLTYTGFALEKVYKCIVSVYPENNLNTVIETDASADKYAVEFPATHVDILRGQDADFTISLNIPLPRESGVTGSLTIKVYDPNENHNCGDATFAAKSNDSCGLIVYGTTDGTAGNVGNITIKLTVKNNNVKWYQPKSSFNFKVAFEGDGLEDFMTGTFSQDFSVSVVENADYWAGVCFATNDPRYFTFDWNYYSINAIVGNFKLYQHQGFPAEVEITTENCMLGTCVCAVAVRAGQDVFITDHCSGGHFTKIVHGTGNLLKILQYYRGSYKIIFPHGTEVYIYITPPAFGVTLLHVYIFSSPADMNNVLGLCGKLNGNMDDDFTHSDGTVTARDIDWWWWQREDPNAFAESWQLNDEDSLFDYDVLTALVDWNEEDTYSVCMGSAGEGGRVSSRHEARTCNIEEPDVNARYIPESVEYITSHLATRREMRLAALQTRRKRSTTTSTLTMQEAVDECNTGLNVLNIPFSLNSPVGPAMDVNATAALCAQDKQVCVVCNRGKYNLKLKFSNSSSEQLLKCARKIGATEKDVVSYTDGQRTGGIFKAYVLGVYELMPDVDWQVISATVVIAVANATANHNNSLSSTEVQTIQANACPDGCSGHGTCTAQQCTCDAGFGGDNCGISSTAVLEVALSVDITVCGTMASGCNSVALTANGILETAVCQLTITAITTPDFEQVIIGVDTYLVTVINMYEFECTIPETSRRRRRSTGTGSSDAAIVYSISASNDGSTFGNSVTTAALDNTCLTYNSTSSTVTLDANYCLIEGTCYQNGVNQTGQTCNYCDISLNVYGWTLSSGYCLIDNVCYTNGTVKSDDSCKYCHVTADTNAWTNDNVTAACLATESSDGGLEGYLIAIIVLCVLIVLGGAAAGAYFLWRKYTLAKKTNRGLFDTVGHAKFLLRVEAQKREKLIAEGIHPPPLHPPPSKPPMLYAGTSQLPVPNPGSEPIPANLYTDREVSSKHLVRTPVMANTLYGGLAEPNLSSETTPTNLYVERDSIDKRRTPSPSVPQSESERAHTPNMPNIE